jgi:hypothetical protein
MNKRKLEKEIEEIPYWMPWPAIDTRKNISTNFTMVTTAASAPRPVRWDKRCSESRYNALFV